MVDVLPKIKTLRDKYPKLYITVWLGKIGLEPTLLTVYF